jgi:hypothetical protein
MDLFLDLYQAGFELPPLDSAGRLAGRAWLERARAELFLCIAEQQGAPAAVGVLYVKDGIGLLADAATQPKVRGLGCHAALVRERIREASRQGCDLLTSFVGFGSSSHRNLARAGLGVAYTKALWWQVK